MKAMVCEMCGSQDIIKQDGMYVCQYCGTRYSIDEARKLIVEGTVKIDHSDELQRLYKVARRARDNNNAENAQKYYDMILVKDPSSWEANFYTVYYQSMCCKIKDIRSAAIRVSNCENTVLELIRDNVPDPDEQGAAISEVGRKLITISRILFNSATDFYLGISMQVQHNYKQECINNCYAARDILYKYGNYLIDFFGDAYGDVAASCWKDAIQQHNILMPILTHKDANEADIHKYANKIKEYDSSYQEPEVNKGGGCYVATAIYGSYDCPQVWTLRRFRDNALAETWYGRTFIHTYYAISPTIVKWFGNTAWFKNMWKPTLDRMVERLNHEGVEDTPYNDRNW